MTVGGKILMEFPTFLNSHSTFHIPQQAPLVVSSPHLLGANQAKAAMIKGLEPDSTRHLTKFNIEPNTGLLLQANKRIQYNVLITRVRGQVGVVLIGHQWD